MVRTMSCRSVELLSVPLKVVHELIDSDLSFARVVAYQLARAAGGMDITIRQGERGTGRFVMPSGKRVVASQLGMAAENLSRNLALLAAHGVAVRGRQVSVTDRNALAELACAGDATPAHENAPPLVHFSLGLRARTRSHVDIERASKKGHPALVPD
jgi:hypothetical protein